MSSDEIEEIKTALEADWPNLAQTHYRITSKHTAEYNCLAWVVCEQDRWWSPIPEDEYYWPEGVSREETLKAFTEAYQTCGY